MSLATAQRIAAENTSALEPILSPREASLILGVAVATLARWRWAGHGGPPFIKIGARKCGYRASTLRDFVREHTSTADHEGTALSALTSTE